MNWAREREHVVFTHDLDFSAMLAATEAKGPSVLQVRSQDVLPRAIGQTYWTAYDFTVKPCLMER